MLYFDGEKILSIFFIVIFIIQLRFLYIKIIYIAFLMKFLYENRNFHQCSVYIDFLITISYNIVVYYYEIISSSSNNKVDSFIIDSRREELNIGIKLFEHNQTAFDSALEMLAETSKAAVIHPTGTGKSYIGFKLCEQFPDKKVCWLSPSEYIYKTQLENLKNDSDGYQPENIAFFTYAKLMLLSGGELEEIKPDYIVLDEFHRCGAEMWGEGVDRLLKMYPDTPLLGLSATAIRYLDNQRNMADELFDGNIASEMTLGEAIVRGILNPPKYVLSVFTYKDDYLKLEKRVRSTKNKAVKDRAEKDLEAMRRALEMADGLGVIFDKHIENRTGKYIVFCANIEHLREMCERIGEWFGRIDPKPHVYTAYSEDPATSKEFVDFKNDNSNHLKLLFAIDMLNEGIHVDDISGVILFRPTVSPIIYKQQIGRALAAGKQSTPVIFDIVNNIENLYSIGTIEQEVKVAVSYYRSLGLDSYIVNDRFEVVDEVKDVKELFDDLEECLTASWDLMYSYAKRYYELNGNLEIPTKYKTPEGYSLGSWLLTQRRVYAGVVNGRLDDEKIKKLEAIGINWESRADSAWNCFYNSAKEYYQKNGDLQVPASFVTEDGLHLGRWIGNIRAYRKNGIKSASITPERIKKLDDIGMIWDGFDYLWYKNFSAALQYYREHGSLDIPVNYVDKNGIKLYSWIMNIKVAYRKSNLSPEQTALLESIGIDWRTIQEKSWDEAFEQAKRYYIENGNLDIAARYTSPGGYKLGKWISNQRLLYRKGKLAREKSKELENIGMCWSKRSFSRINRDI